MKILKFNTLLLVFASLVFLTACDDDDPKVVAPVAPVAADATEITDVSFKANWAAVTGAEKYQLDVSTVNTFATFVTGYNKKEVTLTSQVINGLEAETPYYYRVYAKKGTLTSVASATKTVTTTD